MTLALAAFVTSLVSICLAMRCRAFGRGISRASIKGSICYCSVFEECWIRGVNDRKPLPVLSSTAAAVAYQQ